MGKIEILQRQFEDAARRFPGMTYCLVSWPFSKDTDFDPIIRVDEPGRFKPKRVVMPEEYLFTVDNYITHWEHFPETALAEELADDEYYGQEHKVVWRKKGWLIRQKGEEWSKDASIRRLKDLTNELIKLVNNAIWMSSEDKMFLRREIEIYDEGTVEPYGTSCGIWPVIEWLWTVSTFTENCQVYWLLESAVGTPRCKSIKSVRSKGIPYYVVIDDVFLKSALFCNFLGKQPQDKLMELNLSGKSVKPEPKKTGGKMSEFEIIIDQLNSAASDFRGLSYTLICGKTEDEAHNRLVDYTQRHSDYEIHGSSTVKPNPSDMMKLYRTHVIAKHKCHAWNLVEAWQTLERLAGLAYIRVIDMIGSFDFQAPFMICCPMDIFIIAKYKTKKHGEKQGKTFLYSTEQEKIAFEDTDIFLNIALQYTNIYNTFQGELSEDDIAETELENKAVKEANDNDTVPPPIDTEGLCDEYNKKKTIPPKEPIIDEHKKSKKVPLARTIRDVLDAHPEFKNNFQETMKAVNKILTLNGWPETKPKTFSNSPGWKKRCRR